MADYREEFFETLDDAGCGSAEVVLGSVLALLEPDSLLDVGCGTGIWSATALSLGVDDVLGIDGDYVPRHQLRLPGERFRSVELGATFDLGRRFDLAICVEVAEHLEPGRADGFVADLCAHADALVFSAATPKQGGTHHVNEQWPDYWTDRFARHGYTCWDLIRPLVRYDPRVAWIYRQNVMVVLGPGHGALERVAPSSRMRGPEPGDVAFEYVARYIVERQESARTVVTRAAARRLDRLASGVRRGVLRHGSSR